MEITVPKALVVTLEKNTGVIQLTAAAEVMVIHPSDVPLPSEQHMYKGTTHAEIPSVVSPLHRALSPQVGPVPNVAWLSCNLARGWRFTPVQTSLTTGHLEETGAAHRGDGVWD